MASISMGVQMHWRRQPGGLLHSIIKGCLLPGAKGFSPLPMLLWTLLASSGLSAIPTAQAGEVDPCSPAMSTLEMIECRGKQMEAANKKLQTYLKAAQKQAASTRLNPEKIVEEQVAWERFRELHCGNIYLFWFEGSIRYEKVASCNLKLTKDRTFDLWRAYLSQASSPPFLANPDLSPPMLPLQCRFNREKAMVALRLDKKDSFTLIWSDGPRQAYTWVGAPSATHNLTDGLGGRWQHRIHQGPPERQGFSLRNLDNGNLIQCE